MATTSKKFRADEINSIVTNVHETLPVTGSLVVDNNNIKSYSHDRYISVYDADPLLASANQLMDISYCNNVDIGIFPDNQVAKERSVMYNQFAQVLVGYDTDGSKKTFQVASGSSSEEIEGFYAISLPRYMVKDKIDSDSFKFEFSGDSDSHTVTISGSINSNSPAGGYYELQSTSRTGRNSGLLFVEAGVMILSIEALAGLTVGSVDIFNELKVGIPTKGEAYDAFRQVFDKLTFKNTVEVNSTIYTCQVSFGDFNYSNNPTFTDASGSIPTPSDKKTYITGIGLHGPAGELLATAKLSQPKEKTNAKNYLFNVRLDY